MTGGCLNLGVKLVSKSENSLKNLLNWNMILNMSSLLGLKCISNPSILLLYSLTGSNPISSNFYQYLHNWNLLFWLKSNKKFSILLITSLRTKCFFYSYSKYVISSNFLRFMLSSLRIAMTSSWSYSPLFFKYILA